SSMATWASTAAMICACARTPSSLAWMRPSRYCVRPNEPSRRMTSPIRFATTMVTVRRETEIPAPRRRLMPAPSAIQILAVVVFIADAVQRFDRVELLVDDAELLPYALDVAVDRAV